MKPVHRLDPGADRDAAPSAAGPLPLIDSPEDEALLRVGPPFPETGVVVDWAGTLIAGFSFGNRACRAELGATLTGHAEVMEPEGDRLIRLQRQIGRHRLESHVVAVFR